MYKVANFFTVFWMVYFPTCVAYNDLPGFSSVDEVMTLVILAFTFMQKGKKYVNNKPWGEFFIFLAILAFYIVYSLLFGQNVAGGIWLDTVQTIRPFSIVYCTWILNPRFSPIQKKLMLGTMIVTLFSWILYHPETTAGKGAEFPVLGQLAICTGMAYYLFSDNSDANKVIALLLASTGLLAPKFKYIGELVCFVALMFKVKSRLNFTSAKTLAGIGFLVLVIAFFTWERLDGYYISGLDNEELARPMTYKTSLKVLVDYFPLGPGMGTFASLGAWRYYSPLYPKYGLDQIWGLDAGGGFICDAFYPSLTQFGIVGVILFGIFWKRRLQLMNRIMSAKYYRVAFMTFLCLAIEQTADSSWLSGKGMGYCMLLGLCFNAKTLPTKKTPSRIWNIRNLQRKKSLTDRQHKEERKPTVHENTHVTQMSQKT